MSHNIPENNLTEARLPRGFVDRTGASWRSTAVMLKIITDVYAQYGFEPLETPIFEYTDALGKFLPDSDRPNEGVFSLQDEDEQWLSLRYDLTAPLARFFAENFEKLPKPYRSFRYGSVFRNEKPGPGRFRQFIQCDADIVGTGKIEADAEICLMAADIMVKLGLKADEFRVNYNHRKLLDVLLEKAEISSAEQRLTTMRAIDKLDRVGLEGVEQLLTTGRKDITGDFTKGAGLSSTQAHVILQFLQTDASDAAKALAQLEAQFSGVNIAIEAIAELRIFAASVAHNTNVVFAPTVVRGLEYYTGPVFEAELTFETVNEKGEKARFGSVGGGGRYDGLVSRFRAEPAPATGFSVGVSRLQAALEALGRLQDPAPLGPVVIMVLDKDRMADYFQMAAELRAAGIKSEVYLGESGMKAQVKYADRRNAPCVIMEGSNEKAEGVVQVKDLIEGAIQAKSITDNAQYRAARPAQEAVKRSEMVAYVKALVARYEDVN